MDDHLAGMDAEKRRRGSLALLRALYPGRFYVENVPDVTAPAAEECPPSPPDDGSAPPRDPSTDEGAFLAGHRQRDRG